MRLGFLTACLPRLKESAEDRMSFQEWDVQRAQAFNGRKTEWARRSV